MQCIVQESDSFAMREWDRSWVNREWEASCAVTVIVKEYARSWSGGDGLLFQSLTALRPGEKAVV